MDGQMMQMVFKLIVVRLRQQLEKKTR